MALDVNIKGSTTGTAEFAGSGNNQLKVIPETDALNSPENIGGVRIFGENDQGSVTGVVALKSPEVDVDYRQRASQDLMLDEESFYYAAQNTGKHLYQQTTLTNLWAAGQLTTNNAGNTTSGGWTEFSTKAFFPIVGTTTLSADFATGFSAQPVTNAIIEFGFGLVTASSAAPTDGVFFRLTSAGLQGIASFNGTETSTGVFPLSNGTGTWTYNNNQRYQFIVYIGQVEAQFWVNDGDGAVLLGTIPRPVGRGRMCLSAALPLLIKHRNVGTASGAISSITGAYSVRLGGPNVASKAAEIGNRAYGSYQGLSGGTMGSLANYANSANPTAAVPTNTTAALGTGLGGQFWETASLAVNTDGIICSYQVPAGTVSVPGRRLVITGVYLTSYIQTVIVGGPYVAQYSLAFGHTSVSLAQTETTPQKAPRRIALPFTQLVTAAQAVSTLVAQATYHANFEGAPIYVNPGEFVAIATKHVGTVGTSGVVAHTVTFVYGWE